MAYCWLDGCLSATCALIIISLAQFAGIAHGAPPITVPASPAKPLYTAANSGDPIVRPRINGVIYDGPEHPVWDKTGTWSKWSVKTDRTLTPIVGIHVAHIPGTDAYLFNGRSSAISFSKLGDIVSGVYNRRSNTFRNVTTETNPFCGGLSLTHDGRVLVAGGTTAEQVGGAIDGRYGVRLYNYTNNATYLPDKYLMRYPRWYPSVTLLPDNNIFIMGGTRTATEKSTPWPYFERWDAREGPTRNKPIPRFAIEPTFMKEMGKQFYPSMFVLPTGEVFILQDQYSRILKASGVYRNVTDPVTKETGPLKGPMYPSLWKTQFPHAGSAAMLGLTWEDNYGSAEIVMFGGSPFPDTDNVTLWCPSVNNTAKTTPANPYSYRLKISWALDPTTKDWVYTFGKWVEEFMGIPRVGGDSVLLPNGDVVITGGAQTGCACGIRDGVNRGNYPALWPLLYQPERPEGQRYTVLSATSIARMYHGTAVLTTDGTVLVQGCDACEVKTLISTASWWIPSPDKRWEFRIEEFSPPYALDLNAKPKITGVNGKTDATSISDIAYGATFTITWAPLVPSQTDVKVSKVSLVAPSAVTHQFNSNQRVVFLKIVSQVGNTLTVQVPSTVAVLPPQIYKIFIMNGKTYSTAWWVKLTKPGVPVGRRLSERVTAAQGV